MRNFSKKTKKMSKRSSRIRRECSKVITEEDMAKNFPKSTKEIMVQIQEVLTSLKKDQLNIYTHTEAHELKTHTHTLQKYIYFCIYIKTHTHIYYRKSARNHTERKILYGNNLEKKGRLHSKNE